MGRIQWLTTFPRGVGEDYFRKARTALSIKLTESDEHYKMTVIIFGALLIGITIGLLGSGGSAITVPVLVYLVGHGAKVSIAESMAIVGIIAIAAAIPYARSRQIDWKSVAWFGPPGMAGTLIGAWLGGLATDAIQLIVFGVVLVLAAVVMVRKAFKPIGPSSGLVIAQPEHQPNGQLEIHKPYSPNPLKLIADGLAVGTLTGFVGMGGGFLIVPALVILAKLPMRLAIGTSLVIIVVKSATGFVKYQHYLLDHAMTVDWATIAIFGVIGVLGSIVGRQINTRLNQRVLQQVFALFLVAVGTFVVIREGSEAYFPAQPPSVSATERGPETLPIGAHKTPFEFGQPAAALASPTEFNLKSPLGGQNDGRSEPSFKHD